MLEWLADHVSVFKMQHNAHREFNMSVAEHLSHRERIGDPPSFLSARDRDACIADDQLWEMRIILPDGASLDIAGSTLANCINVGRHVITQSEPAHIAHLAA